MYVLPSYYPEGTPRTVLEAMSMGRAIITADSVGCRETVIVGRNGYLVAPRDAAAVADAMQQFIQDPGLIASMGVASRQLAEQRFDVHKVNQAILEGLSLCRGRSEPPSSSV